MRTEHVIGQTASGHDILAAYFAPPEYATPKPAAVLFAAIHGDEPIGVHCLAKLADELDAQPPGRETWIVFALNLDGLLGGSKNNANDVDLNRNFAARNWEAAHKPGYSPGKEPESEPETQALVALIERSGAARLIALHSPYRVVNWDGCGEGLAQAMGDRNGYEVSGSIGYPTPGSFGSKYGGDQNLEVVTLEIPFQTDASAWRENREALRFAVDLP